MQAEPTAQRHLLQIAAIDTETAQLLHRRRNPPEQCQLVLLNRRRIELGERLVAVQTATSDANAEFERLEADLAVARQRLARDQQRVDAGGGDQRALKGLLDEIDHLNGRISDLEDAELEQMQAIDDRTAEASSVSAERTQVETEMRELLRTRDANLAQIDGDLTTLGQRRAGFVADIPKPLLEAYDKVAAKTGSTGAAELRNGNCTGCGLHLDASEIARANAAAASDVLRCEECGRILVR